MDKLKFRRTAQKKARKEASGRVGSFVSCLAPEPERRGLRPFIRIVRLSSFHAMFGMLLADAGPSQVSFVLSLSIMTWAKSPFVARFIGSWAWPFCDGWEEIMGCPGNWLADIRHVRLMGTLNS